MCKEWPGYHPLAARDLNAAQQDSWMRILPPHLKKANLDMNKRNEENYSLLYPIQVQKGERE